MAGDTMLRKTFFEKVVSKLKLDCVHLKRKWKTSYSGGTIPSFCEVLETRKIMGY